MKLYNLALGAILVVISQALVECTALIKPVQLPVAVILAPETVTAGNEIIFDGSASYHPQGLRLISWEWSFPDGIIKEGMRVSHTFWDYGFFEVVLKVVDEQGNSGFDKHTIEVLNPPPVAVLEASSYRVPRGQVVTFVATRSYDPAGVEVQPKGGGQIVFWHWEFRHELDAFPETVLFGDLQIVKYAFWRLGRYEVKLTVTDRGGAQDSKVLWVEVFNLPPTADFRWQRGCSFQTPSFQEQGVVIEGEVLLDGTLSQDPDGRIVKWDWMVENIFLSGSTICLRLQAGKSYQATLWVTDNDGATSFVTRIIRP